MLYIYAIGGGESYFYNPIVAIEKYDPDPETDTCTYTTDMPRARLGHTASVVNGKIYIFGGSIGYHTPSLSTVEVYNSETDTWSEKTNMPAELVGASAATFDEKVYVTGGSLTAPPLTVVKSTYEYKRPDPVKIIVPGECTLAQIFPNPANRELSVFLKNGAKIEEATIYNLKGQKVFRDEPQNNIIDISELQPGMYIIELVSGQKRIRAKLVVE